MKTAEKEPGTDRRGVEETVRSGGKLSRGRHFGRVLSTENKSPDKEMWAHPEESAANTKRRGPRAGPVTEGRGGAAPAAPSSWANCGHVGLDGFWPGAVLVTVCSLP